MSNISKNKSKNSGLGLISLGWELAVPIFGGVLIGYQLDRFLGLNFTFTLILLLVGIITGYYNLYKHIELEMLRMKAAKRQTHKQEKEKFIS
jgi:predicted F0F1-ATPase subunit